MAPAGAEYPPHEWCRTQEIQVQSGRETPEALRWHARSRSLVNCAQGFLADAATPRQKPQRPGGVLFRYRRLPFREMPLSQQAAVGQSGM